jgi:DNA-binding NarL/FixJ family response regulator
MLTNNSRGECVHKAIKLGANGYISKFAEFEEVLKAIYSVINNEAYLCKDSFQNLMHEMSDDFIVAPKHEDLQIDYLPSSPFCSFSNSNDALISEKFKNGITSLTLREREILNYIINGKTTQQISEDLFISYRTVETHRKNILYKLGVKNTLSLIKLSYEYSLVHN